MRGLLSIASEDARNHNVGPSVRNVRTQAPYRFLYIAALFYASHAIA